MREREGEGGGEGRANTHVAANSVVVLQPREIELAGVEHAVLEMMALMKDRVAVAILFTDVDSPDVLSGAFDVRLHRIRHGGGTHHCCVGRCCSNPSKSLRLRRHL